MNKYFNKLRAFALIDVIVATILVAAVAGMGLATYLNQTH